MSTQPPIFQAQNEMDSRRLVAAQARLYSDAKRLFFGRVIAVVILALAAMATSSIWSQSRLILGGGGGLVLFLGSLLVETIEKRSRNQAAATQELFDTKIYQLDWNELSLPRPSSAAIARAASRYDGARDANWYDDTGQIERPFDILICQGTNLGWGASMHRIWGWTLFGVTVLATLLIIGAWIIFNLTFEQALLSVLIPALAPAKEVIALIRGNFDSATEKEKAERSINDLWDRGMKEAAWSPQIESIRSVQDKIFSLRQANSYVPDWLDSMFHSRNEAAMRESVSDKVEQARRQGRVL